LGKDKKSKLEIFENSRTRLNELGSWAELDPKSEIFKKFNNLVLSNGSTSVCAGVTT